MTLSFAIVVSPNVEFLEWIQSDFVHNFGMFALQSPSEIYSNTSGCYCIEYYGMVWYTNFDINMKTDDITI